MPGSGTRSIVVSELQLMVRVRTNCLVGSCNRLEGTVLESGSFVRFDHRLRDDIQSEVEFHVECSSERSEEMGHKLGSTIGSDVARDTMLGEDV